ncbi:hypothetical protein B0H19DRAFT_1376970 [Mycena capillaripes]|nr:hypothetical protein B0H19DRAFT_1376970 [Mycena capillaripes]
MLLSQQNLKLYSKLDLLRDSGSSTCEPRNRRGPRCFNWLYQVLLMSKISEPAQHPSDSPTLRRTGPSIPPVASVSTRLRQHASDSPHTLDYESSLGFLDAVYAGLRKFHEGKRLDPESQDLARHLGYPVFQLSGDTEVPFTYGEA